MTIHYEACERASNGDERVRLMSTDRIEITAATVLVNCSCNFGPIRVGNQKATRVRRKRNGTEVAESYMERTYNVIQEINIECMLHSQYNSPYPIAKTVMK